MQNVQVFFRRHLYPNEHVSHVEELPELDPDPHMLPYRRITKSQSLVLDQHGGCSFEVYGALRYDAPSKPLKKQSIGLLLTGDSEVRFMSGIFTLQSGKEVVRYKSAILAETDPSPQPDASGKIVLPFNIVFRTSQALPISFKSPSAKIKYRLSFKYICRDSVNTVIKEYTLPVTLTPAWTDAPPPLPIPPPASETADDGTRIVLDLGGEIQGESSVLDADSPTTVFIRPRVLNNIHTETLAPILRNETPAYSEIDVPTSPTPRDPYPEETLSIAPSTRAGSFWQPHRSMPRRGSNTAPFGDAASMRSHRTKVSLLKLLKPTLSQESIVVPVLENEPLPYTEHDPLSLVLLEPPVSPLDAPAFTPTSEYASSARGLSTRMGSFASSLHLGGSGHHHVHAGDSRISFTNQRARFSAHIDTDHGHSDEDEEEEESDDDEETEGEEEGEGEDDEFKDTTPPVPQHSPVTLLATTPFVSVDNDTATTITPVPLRPQSRLFSLLSPSPLPKHPLFRVIIPCTMAGPSSILPIHLSLQSLPESHRPKSLLITLRALVKCQVTTYTKTDKIPLRQYRFDLPSTPVYPLFEKYEIEIPRSSEMGVYACGFKAPFFTLSHELVFSLRTECQWRWRSGARPVEFDLGRVSVDLLR
ncbi:hypothetical protein BCR33DRAFT_853300 [Rhizoclosmatium globosum]|uniref:Uncharacterized protein n=1 Tax=Rhizoclosmatium globosum TaxID=329046 RepID=A0A1Y2BXN3_9FUNG|nr:hypothetical protein BCR33DRAFT_853300 [Rhizoclosmatium globosum]|eukprot:ORY39508.1 hypothetical protein BCR33DRAFT_853300 [Rhizoclosmatium globosum]